MKPKKLTPKQYAKSILYDKISGLCDFGDIEVYNQYSEKQQHEIDRHLEKYIWRVLRILEPKNENS